MFFLHQAFAQLQGKVFNLKDYFITELLTFQRFLPISSRMREGFFESECFPLRKMCLRILFAVGQAFGNIRQPSESSDSFPAPLKAELADRWIPNAVFGPSKFFQKAA